ncbi:Gamma-glutamyl peptidase [Thalictrum thalictroides]|uniref:Gamma-glutamyl peptidase n=1 Tax=Thalictrum thalictroides TaxID=46969 RepID=A0A7J6W1J5_THATH|nr:Gamma-glutamyl peptidase [Thalictrum thalictroides]
MGEKRFAVLLCAQDSEYVKKKYGGYYGVFVNLLSEEGESWDVYRVANGEFPEEDELEFYDGFVITGSSNDAHGNDIWILKLLNLLKKLDSMKKKILGVCFGHQILGRALGGKTGRSLTGWDIGIRSINLSTSKSFKSLQLPSKLSVIEFHQDEVKELPPSVEVIAWSQKTGIEMYKSGDHIMGIQGHPEYTKDILVHLIDRTLKKNAIQDQHVEVAMKSIESSDPDREAWKRLCKSFLKGNTKSY